MLRAVAGPGAWRGSAHGARLVAAALGALLLVAAGARAQDAAPDPKAARAKALFQQAVTDYDGGRYDAALAGFQEAFRIKPHPMVRVNMANCYDKLGKPLQAIVHFERFLASNTGSPAQRKEVGAAIARLEKQVGALSLQVAPDGAKVVVDAGDRRTAPIAEPIRLPAGKHSIVVELAGYTTVKRELEVSGGRSTELVVTLEPAKPTPAPPPPVAAAPVPTPAAEPAGPTPPAPKSQPEPEPAEAQQSRAAIDAATAPEPAPSGSRISKGAWIAGGVTAALLLGATVTGLVALSAQDEFRNQRAILLDTQAGSTTFERIDAYNEAQDAADRANALALTTDILLGGALIGGALTTYLLFNNPERSAQTRLTPTLAPGHAGLSLQGHL
jgi:hypothetical protein